MGLLVVGELGVALWQRVTFSMMAGRREGRRGRDCEGWGGWRDPDVEDGKEDGYQLPYGRRAYTDWDWNCRYTEGCRGVIYGIKHFHGQVGWRE